MANNESRETKLRKAREWLRVDVGATEGELRKAFKCAALFFCCDLKMKKKITPNPTAEKPC